MILSASRRTDIPSYYSDWFYNRIKEGFVCVRNPMNIHQISKIKITQDVVDCIVFWTKNPAPMIKRLDELKKYHYYFQFTLNSYGKDIETNIPSKGHEIIDTFKRLSEKIGKEKVIWRYDPILLNKKYSIEYHINYFGKIAEKLHDYTEKCTISFIDFYRKTTNNVKNLYLEELNIEKKKTIALNLYKITNLYGLKLETCAEDIELGDLGIEHGRCIDDRLIERIIGCKLNVQKDKNQRMKCGCVSSIDIGMYNTCMNGCKYCYANYSMKTVQKNFSLHDKHSCFNSGVIHNDDIIKDREVKSLREKVVDLF